MASKSCDVWSSAAASSLARARAWAARAGARSPSIWAATSAQAVADLPGPSDAGKTVECLR